MLSYLHGFHAGNFADVQKHSALWLIQSMMHSKASPIACFDSHAGSGDYDLTDERARKTREAEGGIQKLWKHQPTLLNHPDWCGFLARLREALGGIERSESPLTRYPGSPQWLACGLRSEDRLTAFELHPTEQSVLKDWAATWKENRVNVVTGDGFKGVVEALPPSGTTTSRQPRPSSESGRNVGMRWFSSGIRF